jgi:hypothetical protein
MSKYIFGYENWKKHYASLKHKDRKQIWIFIKTKDDREIYLRQYEDWLDFQKFVDENNLHIKSIGLKYKSNQIEIDTSDSDGVYLIKSVKGQFGGKSKQCYTTGIVRDGKIKKTMWITPELLEDHTYTDKIEDSFEEAIVYHEKQKN